MKKVFSGSAKLEMFCELGGKLACVCPCDRATSGPSAGHRKECEPNMAQQPSSFSTDPRNL